MNFKKYISVAVFYILCIHDLVCAGNFASADGRGVDFIIKVMQTRLENVKILIKLNSVYFLSQVCVGAVS